MQAPRCQMSLRVVRYSKIVGGMPKSAARLFRPSSLYIYLKGYANIDVC